jgi:C-terminal processing protease CtpA/Prc
LEQFKRVHKSGYFGGLPDSFVDDFDDLLPDDLESKSVRAQKIVLSQDTVGVPTGISVTGVPDPKHPDRLSAVEVYRIEENQRIALDGQIQIGDRIIKINNRPIYQMSLSAAGVYLDELKREEEPSIVFYRLPRIEATTKKESNVQLKPIMGMVQQGNTAALHNLKDISITKGNRGFGFGFASRRSERGNIFLITSIVPNGPSDELLLSGDRLIKIDDKDLSDLTQNEVTDMIKTCPVGKTLIFQVSRTEKTVEQVSTNMSHETDEVAGLELDDQILEFNIPVNETAAAGLGLVLKGKTSSNLDGKQIAAVFIDRVRETF